MNTVIVMVGLQASGKTNKSLEYLNSKIIIDKIDSPDISIKAIRHGNCIQLDNFIVYEFSPKTVVTRGELQGAINFLKNFISLENIAIENNATIILDGLILTNDLFSIIAKEFENDSIIFEYFNNDINNRLYNGQHYLISSWIINGHGCNKLLELPDMERLKYYNDNVVININPVIRKSNFDLFFINYFYYKKISKYSVELNLHMRQNDIKDIFGILKSLTEDFSKELMYPILEEIINACSVDARSFFRKDIIQKVYNTVESEFIKSLQKFEEN